jgi:hypothetical protein
MYIELTCMRILYGIHHLLYIYNYALILLHYLNQGNERVNIGYNINYIKVHE